MAINFSGIEVSPGTGSLTGRSIRKPEVLRDIRAYIRRATLAFTKDSTFYRENLRAILNLLGDIKYRNSEEGIEDVMVRHANPERTIAKLRQRDNIILPIVTISQLSTDAAIDRRRYSESITYCSVWDENKQRARRVVSVPPVPVNITYDVYIWSKYKHNLDQILVQIRNKFNPGALLVTPFNSTTKAFLSDEVTESSVAISDREDRILRSKISITVESYIPSPQFLLTNTGEIETAFFEEHIIEANLPADVSSGTIASTDPSGEPTPTPSGMRDWGAFITTESGTYQLWASSTSAAATTVSCAETGEWTRYRGDLGGFELVMYMQNDGSGACYTLMNSMPDSTVGYFTRLGFGIDGETPTVASGIAPVLGGGAQPYHIIPQTTCHAGTLQEFIYTYDETQPDTRYFLDDLAQSELNKFTDTALVGPFRLYNNTIDGGDAGGWGVGYYHDWMKASIPALIWNRTRAEEISRRTRIFITNPVSGGPMKLNVPWSQTRAAQLKPYHYQTGSWNWNAPDWISQYGAYQLSGFTEIPTGGCEYEEELLNYGSVDGQHIWRNAAKWEVVKDWDPRSIDMLDFLVNDARMEFNTEDNGLTYDGYNLGWLPLEEKISATSAAGSGVGTVWLGRAAAHSFRIMALYGDSNDMSSIQRVLDLYVRNSGVGAQGTVYGSTSIYDIQDYIRNPLNCGTGSSSIYCPGTGDGLAAQAREPQFMAMNYPLFDRQSYQDLYVSSMEPWPPFAYDVSSPSTLYTTRIADWYTLAFGFYSVGGNEDSAAEIVANRGGLLDSQLLSQCPSYMWVDGLSP